MVANGTNTNAVVIAVVGLVDLSNRQVGPGPQVVYRGVPSQLGENGSASWTDLLAPAEDGTYQLRYRGYFTQSNETARANFKNNQEVTNFVGNAAVVTVVTPPDCNVPPLNPVPRGTNATFEVIATGTPPLSYQCRKDAEIIVSDEQDTNPAQRRGSERRDLQGRGQQFGRISRM